jgi:hypothetical protein
MSIVMVRLLGGLANQMFQYALGRRVAIANGSLLRFDIRDLKDDLLRNYELDVFDHRGKVASMAELDFFRPENRTEFTRYIEPHFHFDAKVLDVMAPAYLVGYWQSPKYFSEIRHALKLDFRLNHSLSESSLNWRCQIQDCESVSVHVRRGDYITNAHTNSYHGAVSLKYLENAMRLILAVVPSAEFFVFSDEIEWVAENLAAEAPMHLVGGNKGSRSVEDMFLMSCCKHNIISNSSFSWWAAWLNDNPFRRVIAPTPWFQAPGLDTRDLIEDDWISIKI